MWAIKLKLDADSNDVGSVSATWTEGGEVFSYSTRIKNSTAQINAFGVAVVEARNAWQAKEVDNISKADILLDKLNTYDPQVV